MFQKVKGFQDIYGSDVAYWEKAESVVKKTFELFNFHEMRLPILEKTAVFNRGIGETTDIVEKEMFTFADRDDDLLSLRPEGTAGLVRSYVENGMHNPPELKRFFYLGPMFRRERPQKGRFRQFTQSGVEALGSSSPMLDAEIINLLTTVFKNIGISDYVKAEINSVGCPECRPGYHKILKEYLSTKKEKLCEDCNRRYDKNPLRILDCKKESCKIIIKDAPIMLNHLCQTCKEHFDGVQDYLTEFNVKYSVNPMMVRGLDYYVRTAFEVVTTELGAASAVGAGGRYDGLVKILGGQDTPGVGFAIGMDRVVALMKMKEDLKEVSPLYYIITFGGETTKAGVQLLAELREKGIVADIDYDQKAVKAQMKKADRSGAKYTIIIGEDEISSGLFTVKNLVDGEQKKLTKQELFKTNI